VNISASVYICINMRRGSVSLKPPQYYSIASSKISNPYVPKVLLTGDGAFTLERGNVYVIKSFCDAVCLNQEVWDIDFDDKMLLALTKCGDLVVWKGDMDGYYDGSCLEDNCRQLLHLDGYDETSSFHMVCFRGEAGLICVISPGTLRLVKVDLDLSISLSVSMPLPGPQSEYIVEPLQNCALWGTENLFLAYSVSSNSLYILSIDLNNPDDPFPVKHVHDHQNWVTALSRGICSVSASGDNGGGLTLWRATGQGSIECLHSAPSFIDVAITALQMIDSCTFWVGGADGCLTLSQFNTYNPVPLRMLSLHPHAQVDALFWERHGADSAAPISPSSRCKSVSGIVSSACAITAKAALMDTSDITDSMFSVFPEVFSSPPFVGHKSFISNCLYLPRLGVLVVVDISSDVTLWSLSTLQCLRKLNTGISECDRVMRMEGSERSAESRVEATVYFGLHSGRVIECTVSASEKKLTMSHMTLRAEQSFSVLDLMESLSRPESMYVTQDQDTEARRNVGSLIDDDDSVPGEEDREERGMDWAAVCRPFLPQYPFPPLPVSDLFLSPHATVFCACHARCSLYVHSVRNNAPILQVDLDYNDVVDITQVQPCTDSADTADSDALLLALLGKNMLKVLDATKGKMTFQCPIELPMYSSTSFKPQYCGMWDLSIPGISEGGAGDYFGIVVSNTGSAYAIRENCPPTLVYDSDTDDFSAKDHLSAVPICVKLEYVWNSFIAVISTFRYLTFLKFDMSKCTPSVSRVQKVRFSDEKSRIVYFAAVDTDFSTRTNRVLVVLSDGTSYTLVM